MPLGLETLEPNHVADARNVPCPGPLLTVKESIALVDVGQVLELKATDQGAREDLPAWAKKSGNEYLGSVPHDGYDSHFIVRRK